MAKHQRSHPTETSHLQGSFFTLLNAKADVSQEEARKKTAQIPAVIHVPVIDPTRRFCRAFTTPNHDLALLQLKSKQYGCQRSEPTQIAPTWT